MESMHLMSIMMICVHSTCKTRVIDPATASAGGGVLEVARSVSGGCERGGSANGEAGLGTELDGIGHLRLWIGNGKLVFGSKTKECGTSARCSHFGGVRSLLECEKDEPVSVGPGSV